MGEVHYGKREFCRDIGCEVQQELDARGQNDCMVQTLKDQCRSDCSYSKTDFDMWMEEHRYSLRPTMEIDSDFSNGTCWQYHDWLQKWGVEILRQNKEDE